jgi:glycosyltransferase involved in cell wall biosynthesis
VSVLVAQIGARRHYAVPRALHRRGLLDRLVTDMCSEHALWRSLEAIVPRSMRPRALESLLGRRVAGVPEPRITNLPLFALSPAQKRRSGEALADYWARRNRAFCRDVAGHGFGEARAVYAFNGAALEIFEAAKAQGLATLLDQTAAPWRWNKTMLIEEALRWPGWEDRPAELDVSDALAEREEREWQLADAVICGSAFAAGAVAESRGPEERCAVVPYADHALGAGSRAPAKARPGAPLRVLFVGTLQLRKGVQYLLEAARLLKGKRVCIRLVGPSLLSDNAMRQISAEAEAVGAVARSEVGRHYAWADVLVLPTLSEGSANVCLEAASHGVPVITTPNAGSTIEHGRTGLIIPARDGLALAEAIALLNHDVELRRALAVPPMARHPADALDSYGRALGACLEAATRQRNRQRNLTASNRAGALCSS